MFKEKCTAFPYYGVDKYLIMTTLASHVHSLSDKVSKFYPDDFLDSTSKERCKAYGRHKA